MITWECALLVWLSPTCPHSSLLTWLFSIWYLSPMFQICANCSYSGNICRNCQGTGDKISETREGRERQANGGGGSSCLGETGQELPSWSGGLAIHPLFPLRSIENSLVMQSHRTLMGHIRWDEPHLSDFTLLYGIEWRWYVSYLGHFPVTQSPTYAFSRISLSVSPRRSHSTFWTNINDHQHWPWQTVFADTFDSRYFR